MINTKPLNQKKDFISPNPEGSTEFRFVDATINSIQRKDMAIHGSVDILLSQNELIITGQDASGNGVYENITLGMCETCTDGWKYGEDEYNIDPTLTDTIKVTDIYFFQLELLLLKRLAQKLLPSQLHLSQLRIIYSIFADDLLLFFLIRFLPLFFGLILSSV